MPVTSGLYSFQSINAELLIREAYERIGILGDLLVAQQLDSATRSINFLLTDWSNRNVNLWTLEDFFISLRPGIKTYLLPIQVINVIQAELRTSIRQILGVAAASQGVAANAFDGIPGTACIQTVPNGNISFDYGVNTPQIITFVGIQSNVTTTVVAPYNITVQASNDNATWTDLLTLVAVPFITGVNQWFNLDNILPFQYYRILATDESILNIQEIYFNNTITDTTMTEVSRYEYLTYPKKNMLGRPTIYYVNYQINPTVTIWQNPALTYNCIFYSAQQMVQELTNYTQAIDIPSSFYQPLVYGLAKILAEKYAPDKVQMMRNEYEQAMQLAVVKDTVEVPLTLGVYSS